MTEVGGWIPARGAEWRRERRWGRGLFRREGLGHIIRAYTVGGEKPLQ